VRKGNRRNTRKQKTHSCTLCSSPSKRHIVEQSLPSLLVLVGATFLLASLKGRRGERIGKQEESTETKKY
jgi:hypothetical protein